MQTCAPKQMTGLEAAWSCGDDRTDGARSIRSVTPHRAANQRTGPIVKLMLHLRQPTRRVLGGALMGAACIIGGLAPAHSRECKGDQACTGWDAVMIAASERVAVEQASPRQCRQASITVSAKSAEEHDLACSASVEAIRSLGSCGILPRRPIEVRIMEEVRHPLKGAMFGMFDMWRQTVLVTQEVNVPDLVKGTPYEDLPQRDFYLSLIVHEVVHAVFHQNLKREAWTQAAYEYPAYALQIAALPQPVREQFLKSIPQRAEAKELVFNDTILAFDPFFFAAQAYEHFSAAADGCNHLRALLEGEVHFIPTLPN